MTQKTLSVKLELLTANFAKNLEKSVKSVLASTKKMTDSMQKLGAKMSVAVALPATLLGRSLLKMAGDAEDASDKFSAVFGDSAPKVEKAISNLSKVFNRNTTDLKNYASEFGSMFTSMNLTEEEAGNLSRSMVQLGLDVASLRGVSDSKVMDAFTASLTGNVKSLKTLGVAISEAEIQNEAFALGINKSVNDLDERDKALVMSSLIQKNFAKDVGDASKSQNDWGEVMNRFNAKIKTMGETLGKELIPMVSSLIDKIMPLIDYFISLDDSVKRGAMTLLVFAVLLPPLVTVLGTVGGAIISMVRGFFLLTGAITTAITAINLFIVTKLATYGLTVTGVLKSMSLAMLGFAKVLVPVIVIVGGLVQSVRMAIRFFGFLAGIIGDNADAIVKMFIPATLALVSSLKGVIYAFTYAKNAMEGHQEASNQARIATEAFTEAEDKLKKAWTGEGNTVFADKLREKMYKLEGTMHDSAIGFDDMLVSMKNSTQEFFADSFDYVVDGAKSLGSTIADYAGAGFKASFEYMKDLMIGSLSMLGDFDPFKKPIKPPTIAGTKEAPADIKGMVKSEQPSYMSIPSGGGMGDIRQGDDSNTLGPIEAQKTAWTELGKHIEETMITSSTIVQGAWDNIFNGFSQGISNMILEGASLAETLTNLFKSLADFVIQSIIKMGLQWVTTELMKRAVATTTSKIVQADAIATGGVIMATNFAVSQGQVANNAVVAGTGAASSQAGIPIIGPILAIAAMGAMIASVMAMQGKLKLASGGITQGPTNALIGEKGKEAVIPLDRLDSMLGNREQTIIMNLDGRTLARNVIRNSPREIRLSTGVSM